MLALASDGRGCSLGDYRVAPSSADESASHRGGVGLAPSGSPSCRSVWIFLAGRRFAAKTPEYEVWISLDFLGFSRPNRDLSMGYKRFSEEDFSSRFCPREAPSKRRPEDAACG